MSNNYNALSHTCRIQWSNTGYINVVVATYFVKASLPNIKKLFALAKQFSDEQHRLDLIDELQLAKTFWADYYKKRNNSYLQFICLSKSLPTSLHSPADKVIPNTEIQYNKLQTKLDKVIALLQNDCWLRVVETPEVDKDDDLQLSVSNKPNISAIMNAAAADIISKYGKKSVVIDNIDDENTITAVDDYKYDEFGFIINEDEILNEVFAYCVITDEAFDASIDGEYETIERIELQAEIEANLKYHLHFAFVHKVGVPCVTLKEDFVSEEELKPYMYLMSTFEKTYFAVVTDINTGELIDTDGDESLLDRIFNEVAVDTPKSVKPVVTPKKRRRRVTESVLNEVCDNLFAEECAKLDAVDTPQDNTDVCNSETLVFAKPVSVFHRKKRRLSKKKFFESLCAVCDSLFDIAA